MNEVVCMRYVSPIGEMVLGAAGGCLCLCDWCGEPHAVLVSRLLRRLDASRRWGTSAVLSDAARQLDDYFAGRRLTPAVPLLLSGTAFQQRVWQQLVAIVYGSTMSYGEVARRLGCPGGARAVGAAVGANPVCIFVPCHRVVAARGHIGGFRSGLHAKRFLLQLER